MTRALVTLLLCAALGCETTPAQPAQPAPPPTPEPSATGTAAVGIEYLVSYTAGARASETLPMVVAIHGLGDRPEQFQGLMSGLPIPARVVVPRALKPHGRGFSWFDIRIGNMDEAKLAHGVRHAAGKLAAAIGVLTKRYPTKGKPIVTGFSQGGILSFALAVLHPRAVVSAVPISGWLPPQLVAKTAVPIVALHGDADRLLPIESTREAVRKLRSLGATVELREYPGVGHTVSAAMQRALYSIIASAAP